MTSAKIIADSISEEGKRITTMQVKFHRFVLAEFNTHRAFSRNFSSSRAIPTKKLLEQVRNHPAIPVSFGKNQAGMQASEEYTGEMRDILSRDWKTAACQAADTAALWADHGVHKQIVNRLIEPFLYVEGIVTSTEWDNFFELRCHPDAQPEIQALAYMMRDALNASTPKPLPTGHWHLPFITRDDQSAMYDKMKVDGPVSVAIWIELAKISAARCCRVSYLKHDGTAPDMEEDLALFEKLAGGVPIHASPLEHQASVFKLPYNKSRNFTGWWQFREQWENKVYGFSRSR